MKTPFQEPTSTSTASFPTKQGCTLSYTSGKRRGPVSPTPPNAQPGRILPQRPPPRTSPRMRRIYGKAGVAASGHTDFICLIPPTSDLLAAGLGSEVSRVLRHQSTSAPAKKESKRVVVSHRRCGECFVL